MTVAADPQRKAVSTPSSVQVRGGVLLDGSLHPKVLWRNFQSQSLGFKITCLYIIFEYIRPQSRFPAIDILPWTMLVIISGVLAMLPDVGRRGWTRSPVNGWLIAYLVVAGVSLVFAEFPSYGLSKWDSLVPWVVIYVLLTNTVTTRDRFLLVFLVYVLCNLRLSQFGLRTFIFSGGIPGFGFRGPVGWFHNQGELGIQMAMFVPLALIITIGLWERFGKLGKLILMMLPLSALLTAVGTNSRGAILAAGIAMVWAMIGIGVKMRTLVGMALLGGVGLLLISDQVWDRFHTMGTDTTSLRRLTFIKDGWQMISDHPVTGIGYFNWMPYYTAYFPPVDDVAYLGTHQLPHNILIQVTAELGLLGLMVFVSLVVWSFVLNKRTRASLGVNESFFRLISHGLDASMVAFLLAGQFVTVLYYPYFWITLSFAVALNVSCSNTVESGKFMRRSRVATGS